jgi:cobalt-precorrin-5B (C1)-methyltransferase
MSIYPKITQLPSDAAQDNEIHWRLDDRNPVHRTKDLRSGYTTGACAAAAAKGALLAVLRQERVAEVILRLPAGQDVTFPLHTCDFSTTEGHASVIKDAGDDPDVTDKAEICCRVTWSEHPGISFERGPGVGLVTKKGLPVPPGEPAINPAPRKLIAETLREVLAGFGDEDRGVVVQISVPRGEELAKKTFNPRLGIVGGISILGTTGIVVPYSTAAWLASVVQGIDVAAAGGLKHLVLTVGERGERLARQLLALPEGAFVQIGPFFGDALRHCAKAGIEKVTLVSMIGKLAKFAAGHESVHSSNSKQDFEFLAAIARETGASEEILAQIRDANTAQEVAGLVGAHGNANFFNLICRRAWEHGRALVREGSSLEVLLTGSDGTVLGKTINH